MDPKLRKSLIKEGYTASEMSYIELGRFPAFSLRFNDHKYALPYRERHNQFKTNIHWGQRKLLLSCIQFLAKYHTLSSRVIYAGAAPGTNVLILAFMFPNLTFDLYDPKDFDKKLYGHSRINIYQQYFVDETAEQYKSAGVLFWSDIRTGSIHDEDFEDQVIENNNMQLRWHQIMKPAKAMYKFRLPYEAGKTKYMQGKIWLQVWAPETSTETRLIVSANPKMKIYDNKNYEQRLFFFNLITRQWGYYQHDVEYSVLCCCFDCRAEVEILGEYYRRVKKTPEDKLPQKICRLSNKISLSLSSRRTLKYPPHGVYPATRMEEKYRWLRKTYKDEVLNLKNKKIEYRNKHLDCNPTPLNPA